MDAFLERSGFNKLKKVSLAICAYCRQNIQCDPPSWSPKAFLPRVKENLRSHLLANVCRLLTAGKLLIGKKFMPHQSSYNHSWEFRLPWFGCESPTSATEKEENAKTVN